MTLLDSLALNRLAIVMDHAVCNFKFFEKFLKMDLDTFSAKHKKKEHQGISDELKYHWQLYNTCVQLYIMAMILTNLLTDDLSIESINNLESKINEQSLDYKEKYHLMEEKIDAYYEKRTGIKIKRGTSKVLEHQVLTKIGVSIITGGVGALSAAIPNETLLKKSEELTEKADNKVLQRRREIMEFEEDALTTPFIDTVSEMKQLYCNPVQISCNEDKVYLSLIA